MREAIMTQLAANNWTRVHVKGCPHAIVGGLARMPTKKDGSMGVQTSEYSVEDGANTAVWRMSAPFHARSWRSRAWCCLPLC